MKQGDEAEQDHDHEHHSHDLLSDFEQVPISARDSLSTVGDGCCGGHDHAH